MTRPDDTACPTCGRVMKMAHEDQFRSIHHCARCGTLRVLTCDASECVVPALVKRCRQLQPRLAPHGFTWHDWIALGIAESINLPVSSTNKGGHQR